MDWFKGKFTGKPHDLHGKIYGFRCRFSLQTNPLNEIPSGKRAYITVERSTMLSMGKSTISMGHFQ